MDNKLREKSVPNAWLWNVRHFVYFSAMPLRNLILVSALALFACKKNVGGPSTGGQTGTPKPIGEQLYNPGDTTG